MENRKSFILHFDSLDVIEELTDEQAGKLFKKMKSYHNGNTYDPKDKLIDILFIQFKNQFDRDIQKYDNTCERNKNNVNKRWNKEDTKNTTGINGITLDTKNTYNKSDSDSDNKNYNDSKNKNNTEVKENIVISDDTLATVPLSNNSFRKELIENIKRKEMQKQTITEMAIILFEDFGYQYNKDETFYSLREWFITLLSMHGKKSDEMGKILFNWHTYWKGQKENKQPKDCKASFSKNPYLNSKFDKNENK